MPAEETFVERGRRTRTQYMGEEAKATRQAADMLVPGLAELSDDANWGRIWSRPGLDLRTRSLCTIAALLALGRYKYAQGHMRAARRLGVSRSEMTEAVVQLTFYTVTSLAISVLHVGTSPAKEVVDVAVRNMRRANSNCATTLESDIKLLTLCFG